MTLPPPPFGDWLEGSFGIPVIGTDGAVACVQHGLNDAGSRVDTDYVDTFELENWWNGMCYNLSENAVTPSYVVDGCDGWDEAIIDGILD